MIFLAVAALGLILFWFFALRPRRGGKYAPPLVLDSTVVPIPFVGVIAEFFKSPNSMVKRCYNDYGLCFTIPVSTVWTMKETVPHGTLIFQDLILDVLLII